MSEEGRSCRISIDLDCPEDDVWRALTDARELVRWFPLQAAVTPGAGGTMRWAWGDAWGGESRIERWEPPRLLRLVDTERRTYDADGNPIASSDGGSPLAVEITLESVAGKTRLTLVHSGFGNGAGWDDELEGVTNGWAFELRGLRHYLSRHKGRDRAHAWARCTTSLPASEAWARLLGAGGYHVVAAGGEGSVYSATGPDGDVVTGVVLVNVPEREIAGTALELGDGVFRLGLHRAAGRTGITTWLSSYDGHAGELEAFGRSAETALARLFPD